MGDNTLRNGLAWQTMTTTHPIAEQLAKLGGNIRFATRFTLHGDPGLSVRGIGTIPLPVDAHTAHRLCAVAHPASHGYKDQTLFDRKVRDTWEIVAGDLRLENPLWLEKALERISRDLGLAAEGRVHAELHNMLVYGPGQFFAPHQDSEKKDGMIGTLVITLPSEFSGGEFVVSHQGKKVASRGSGSKLGLIAFFADCSHEVRPVIEGYRVVLTYNLLVPHDLTTHDPAPETLSALADAIDTFWQGSDRLVYLLDHEYTQASLSWKRLKGADAVRVGALRKVAEALDAEIFLALANIHETWTTDVDFESKRYGDYFDDDEGEEDTPWRHASRGEPEPDELIDGSIDLNHWLGTDGKVEEIQDGRVNEDELCFTLATQNCTPFESEYEGYMGNYGNTLDRWYHRAAVVMWPRTRAFTVRARQSPMWALEQIDIALEENRIGEAREWTLILLPFWSQAVTAVRHTFSGGNTDAQTDPADLLELCLPVAAGLHEPVTAAGLLAPFRMTDLTPLATPWFIALLEHYGQNWCGQLIEQWHISRSFESPDARLQWLNRTLLPLIHTLGESGTPDSPALIARLLQSNWSWLKAHIDQEFAFDPVAFKHNGTAEVTPALHVLLRATDMAQQPLLEQQIVNALVSPDWPLSVALGVLRTAAKGHNSVIHKALEGVYRHCIQVLTLRLQLPERAPGNWSIEPPKGCHESLAVFLRHSEQQTFEWPLRKDGRQAIHQFIDDHQLPVSHKTRRIGSPYTLVLKKTADLFQREAAERVQWEAELAWLRTAGKGF